MNKRERLQAAIQGQQVDRVPVALWRHFPGDDQRAEDLARAHIEFQKTYDWDFVKVSPASSFCIRDWGVEDRWEGNIEGTRRYVRRIIETPDDWLSLRVLDPEEGSLGEQLRCLEILQQEFGTETPYIQTIFSPLAQLKNIAGQETLTLHMRQNAGQIHHALQTVADTTVRFINAAKKRGIAGIFYAVQHATYRLMSEAEYQVFGRPYDLQVLSAISDLWLNVLHLHGSHGMFHLISDYPVQIVNWHDRESRPSVAEGLRRIRGAALAGVDRDVLHMDDPELALEQARDAFEQSGGRRWMLGTGCVILVTTPSGNIHKLRALAEELKPE
ncbi:MAG: uroporphyrinogen decarboxylase family protein [Aggregatilineales bacterium]|nr:uroporphyrinogen decarboxylase family protein [Aggregatilineales bacterium]HPV06087.1 uroporphyrinogen decarboxylase family protein [Aggregatilineales bacterium]